MQRQGVQEVSGKRVATLLAARRREEVLQPEGSAERLQLLNDRENVFGTAYIERIQSYMQKACNQLEFFIAACVGFVLSYITIIRMPATNSGEKK